MTNKKHKGGTLAGICLFVLAGVLFAAGGGAARAEGGLSGRGEDVLRDYIAVRRVDIEFQTRLGGRKGHAFVNAVGVIDESDYDAFGWQVRAYGGQEDSAGFNSGVFYRRVLPGGKALVGGNFFADYESHRHGDFVRYSFGGEWESRGFSLAANYYLPNTNHRGVNGSEGVVAFSREGYDARMRINWTRFGDYEVGFDYYSYKGDYGTEKDDGFRLGGEWYPLPALRAGAFYDTGGEEWGGELAYSWTFGGAQSRPRGNVQYFTPDLFAAVWRENSQRVAPGRLLLRR